MSETYTMHPSKMYEDALTTLSDGMSELIVLRLQATTHHKELQAKERDLAELREQLDACYRFSGKEELVKENEHLRTLCYDMLTLLRTWDFNRGEANVDEDAKLDRFTERARELQVEA